MVRPVDKRANVARLQAEFSVSERRACRVIGADRTSMRYRTRRAPDTALRQRLRELAHERRRFGYRRLFILLRREGERSCKKRIYRLYREEGLAVKKRRARRRASGTRAPILVEAKANARWSLDISCRCFEHEHRMCTISLPAGAAFASSTSSTTSPASALRRSPTHRSRAPAWPVSCRR